MPLIQVDGLSKVYRTFKRKEGVGGAILNLFHRRYEKVIAVDNISFQIEPGELIGYIGPNGAGKSTTIKMLTGILVPTSGQIRVDRFIPYKERKDYTRHIGVVFGQRTQLWWDIAVVESFKLLRKVYQVPQADFDRRMITFNKVLDIEPLLNLPVRKLSLGQRMRCDLVASLLHNPRVLFLDEPTIGLDVIGRLSIRDFLGQINREYGTTIILTTHDLGEIEKLCNRVMIIDHGRILYDDSLDRLRQKYSLDRRIIFQLSETFSLDLLKQRVPTNGAVTWEQPEPMRLKAVFRRDRISAAEVIGQVLHLTPVHDITIEEPSIEEIVGRIYSDGKIQ